MRIAAWRSALRIALLAMIESADAGLPQRRAFLRVGGKSIASHQLDLALSLDCERIICMAKVLEPDMISLQHEAERAGRAFQVVSKPADLAGLVKARDELVVFSEGVLLDPREAAKALGDGAAVLVQPVESGIEAGFERLDLNHAAAGLMRCPGNLAERLLELPADCDVPSALTRIALQSGVAMRNVPASARVGARWQMIRSETDAYAIENDWLALQLGDARSLSPGLWLARGGVLTFGSSLLHAGNSGKFMGLAIVAAMILGIGLGWLEWFAAGFAACAVAWIFIQAASLLQTAQGPLAPRDALPSLRKQMPGWMLDLELVLLAVWGTERSPHETVTGIAFSPVMLVLLARLLPNLGNARWMNWLGDRAVLSLVLSGAALSGVLPEAIRVMCVGLVIAGIAVSNADRG